MRLVVDTNVFFPGLNPKSYFYPILKAIYLNQYRLLVSTPVLLEYEEILQKIAPRELLEEFWLFVLTA